jgi:hypothetical protein
MENHNRLSGQEASDVHHLILLDRSGSMDSIRTVVVEIFNQYLLRLKEDSSDLRRHFLTMYSFAYREQADDFMEHHFQTDVSTVEHLDLEYYQPDGRTPLNDAIVRAASLLYPQLALADVSVKVKFIIITDGIENASVFMTNDMVKLWVTMLQDKGWEIEYLGLGINPEADSIEKGIQHYKSFNTDHEGIMAFQFHLNSGI